MRVASLLPAATEIVCALDRGSLVGRSHECDWPHGVEALPALTKARLRAPMRFAELDAAVRALVREAAAIYEVDELALEEVAPDVVITQDLCEVCAVARGDVERALCKLARKDVRLVSLSPLRLADVWDDVERVGAAIGVPGAPYRRELEARVAALARRPASRPKVLTIEWIDPVMIGGTWMPELVALAGGEPMVTRPGEHAPTLTFAELSRLAPDCVVVKPCGFTLAQTLAQVDAIRAALPAWPCPVWLADGSAYFNRPGPRLAESLALLIAALDGEARPPDLIRLPT